MEKIDFNKKWVVTRLDNPEDTKVVDVPYDAMFYEEIRNQLWNHSYYVETIGSVSEENIRRYMEHPSKSY